MRQVLRVSEYYDLFDVRWDNINDSQYEIPDPNLSNIGDIPTKIISENQTNSFRGFWNNEYYNYNGASNANNTPNNQKAKDLIQIAGKSKAPQAVNQLRIDDNGDIWCYPPNVSVPYWSRIIFRNYDYSINIDTGASRYEKLPPTSSIRVKRTVFPYINWSNNGGDTGLYPIPPYNKGVSLWDEDRSANPTVDAPYKKDFTGLMGNADYIEVLESWDNTPLFLKYDEYPSRSKVIFSQCDKTRNPDIEHRFSYHKGQMEPIKLNLSFSASQYVNDEANGEIWNLNLNKTDMIQNLSKCYWCIEWIYEPDEH